MAFERNRKKLYFDVAFGGTRSCLYFPATPFRSSTTFGDRFGGLLNAMESLTGNAPNSLKAQSEVMVTFVPAHGAFTGVAYSAHGVAIDFVQPTFGAQAVAGSPGGGVPNDANVTRLSYLTTTGAKDLTKVGMSAIYGTLGTARHFSVRVRRPNAGAGAASVSLYGTLYVQRQHSIEV
jgi:hypothetical protein